MAPKNPYVPFHYEYDPAPDPNDPLNWKGIAAGLDPYNEVGMSQFGVNPFLLSTPGEVDKNGNALTQDIDTANKQMTFMKSIMYLLNSPQFNQMAAATSGADTFDYAGFVPGQGVGQQMGVEQEVTDPETGEVIGYTSGGGGSSGGGSSGASRSKGNGYDPYFQAPNLMAAAQSMDPTEQAVFKLIQQGNSPYAIQNDIRKNQPDIDPDELKNIYTFAQSLFTEKSADDRNMLLGQDATGLTGEKDPSILAKAWAKSGQPDPSQSYSEDNLPGDVEARLAGVQPDMRQMQWLSGQIAKLDPMARIQGADNPYFNGTGPRVPKPPAPAAAGAAGPVDTSSMGSKLNARNWQLSDLQTGRNKIADAVSGGLLGDSDSFELYQGPDGEYDNARGIRERFPNWTPDQNDSDRKYVGPKFVPPTPTPKLAQPKPNATPAQVGALGRYGTGKGQTDLTQTIFGLNPDPKLSWQNDQGQKVIGNQAAFRQQQLKQSMLREQQVAQQNMQGARSIAAYETAKSGRTPQKERLMAQMNLLRQFGIQA